LADAIPHGAAYFFFVQPEIGSDLAVLVGGAPHEGLKHRCGRGGGGGGGGGGARFLVAGPTAFAFLLGQVPERRDNTEILPSLYFDDDGVIDAE